MHGEAGKGSARRPCQTTKEEEHLRWALFYHKITFAEFERKWNKLLKQGKIKRDGKVVRCDNGQKQCEIKTREKTCKTKIL